MSRGDTRELTATLAKNQFSLNCQPAVAATDAARPPLYYEVPLHLTAHITNTPSPPAA